MARAIAPFGSSQCPIWLEPAFLGPFGEEKFHTRKMRFERENSFQKSKSPKLG